MRLICLAQHPSGLSQLSDACCIREEEALSLQNQCWANQRSHTEWDQGGAGTGGIGGLQGLGAQRQSPRAAPSRPWAERAPQSISPTTGMTSPISLPTLLQTAICKEEGLPTALRVSYSQRDWSWDIDTAFPSFPTVPRTKHHQLSITHGEAEE